MILILVNPNTRPVLPDDPERRTGANLKGYVAGRHKILVVLFPERGALFSRLAGER